MITKKHSSLFALAAACVLSAGFLSQASAGTVALNYGSRQSGSGGEFNAYSSDSNLAPAALGYASVATAGPVNAIGFETFCLEENEYFTPGNSYYYAISNGAINGGVSGGNPDPISRGTAWLYQQFATGTLTGYTYTLGAAGNASAAALQNTIWWLEGEGADPGASNIFRNAVIALPNYTLNNNGFYGVAVLNLWGDAGHTQLAQDQLILTVGPGLQTVPDGGTTAALLGLGLLGLFFAGRRANRLKTAAI